MFVSVCAYLCIIVLTFWGKQNHLAKYSRQVMKYSVSEVSVIA